MKVGVLSYPMLFQNQGGLQLQIKETIDKLKDIDIDCKLVDPLHEHVSDFDIIHVFGASHGNHHIIQTAKSYGVKVVLSPFVRNLWTKSIGRKARLLEYLVTRGSGYLNRSEYQHTLISLESADALIALSESEKKAIVDAFDIDPQKTKVIGNGISAAFLKQEVLEIKRNNKNRRPVIICVASINEAKNQLELANAAAEMNLDVQIVGHATPKNETYLTKLKQFNNVHYCGSFPYGSSDLAELYAKADIFCLPSLSEILPLTAYEALACGTPVLMTENSAMRFDDNPEQFMLIKPGGSENIKKTISFMLNNIPSPESCRAIVKDASWENVASQIKNVYNNVLNRQQ